MDETKQKGQSNRFKKEYKLLFKNTIFSYLNSYSSYIFSLATSFIIARTISRDLWGILLLGISIIHIIVNLLAFFPPSLSYTLSHYVPRYLIEKEYGKLKSFIRNIFIQRGISTGIFFIISFLIFILFLNTFEIVLENYVHILFILSPLIIKSGFNQIFHGINQGFNEFKFLFYLQILRSTIYIGGLIMIVFLVNPITLESITLIYLMSELIPFVVNSINILITYLRIPTSKDQNKISFKETFKHVFSYGSYVSMGTWFYNTWNNIEFQAIGLLEGPQWVTGYSISINYFAVARFSLSSFSNPLMVSFSRLDKINDYEKLRKLFNLILYYTSFFFLLLAGVFFFATDFFLAFFYTPSYLIYAPMTKLLLIASLFMIFAPQFQALIQGTNKVKIIPKISLLTYTIKASIFLIGLIYFGILGMVIGSIIIKITMLIINIYLCYRIFNFTVQVKKLILLYSMALLSIFIVSILEVLFLDTLNYQFLSFLNLVPIFEQLDVFSILLFILIYFGLNYIFKIFTYEDLEKILTLVAQRKKRRTMIIRIFKIFKPFPREKKSQIKKLNE